MKTVKEVCRLTGVSVRTLHYYHQIGLLVPDGLTPSGYRLYSQQNLAQLQKIMLFKRVGFSLRDIKQLVSASNEDLRGMLDDQIAILALRRQQLDELILLAKEMQTGGFSMNFDAFDDEKIERYAREAKEKWGNTAAYEESMARQAAASAEENKAVQQEFMEIFARFGAALEAGEAADGAQAQALVAELRAYISAHFYTVTDEIFAGLGQMYAAPGEMQDNIDAFVGVPGTAQFASAAIAAWGAK